MKPASQIPLYDYIGIQVDAYKIVMLCDDFCVYWSIKR